MIENVELGMRVRCTAVVKKVFESSGRAYNSPVATGPVTHEIVTVPEFEGLLIGRRWLPDGYVGDDTEYSEYGGRSYPASYFERTGTTFAYLVVESLYKNPVYASPEHTTPV